MKKKCTNCKWFSLEQDEDGDKEYGSCYAPIPSWVVDDLNKEVSIYDTYAKTCESYKKIKENKK